MKTREKIIELFNAGAPIHQISSELKVSIQNVYKHLRSDKMEKEKIKERLNKNIVLSDLDIERLSERIYLKLLVYLK
jgi:transposase-like protein